MTETASSVLAKGSPTPHDTSRSSVLHVCTPCRAPRLLREPRESRAGFKLHRELCAKFHETPLGHHVEIRSAECFSLCPHPCFPGERLEAYVEAIEVLAKANTVLSKFHTERRRAVESRASPTVKDSLDALGAG